MVPSRLSRALLLAARAAGVRLVEECPVHALRVAGGRVEGAETGVGRITVGIVVNCGGAFAGRLAGAPPLPLAPYRTEAVRLDASADAERLSRLVAASDVVLVPSRDGSLTVASLVGVTGFDPRPAAAALGALLSQAASVVPAASAYPVMEIRAGVSATTPDGVALLGETELPGYWAATGLGPWGLTSGPAAAVLVADLLSGGRPALPETPFSPRRFGPAEDDPW
jgi:glycine/D-amino acid oxidase-like deaminating enzyme